MAKGFKDDDGKFHPTDRNPSGISSKDIRSGNPHSSSTDSKKASELKEKKQRFKEVKIWKYDDAPPNIQQKILDTWREKYIGNDTWYAEDDGILYSNDQKIVGYEIFSGNIPKYWDLDRDNYIQFELGIKDLGKFKKAFGISDSLWNKTEYTFRNENERNTKIVFFFLGNEIDLDEPYEKEDFTGIDKEDELTKGEYEKLQQAEAKFNDLIDDSLRNLRANYEDQFKDETIIDHIRANEYDFDEDGNIA